MRVIWQCELFDARPDDGRAARWTLIRRAGARDGFVVREETSRTDRARRVELSCWQWQGGTRIDRVGICLSVCQSQIKLSPVRAASVRCAPIFRRLAVVYQPADWKPRNFEDC